MYGYLNMQYNRDFNEKIHLKYYESFMAFKKWIEKLCASKRCADGDVIPYHTIQHNPYSQVGFSV